MSIVLFRVDERLIHGQVVVGWGTQLKPDRIVVVDDALSDSEWEQELYTLGLPSSLQSSFESVNDARAHLNEWRASPARIMVLTRDIHTMRMLAEGGTLRGDEVNIGGIHHAAGRQPVLPYVFLSADETSELSSLSQEGVVVSARDLPGAHRVDVEALLKTHRQP